MGYFCNEQTFNELVESGSGSSHARQQLETKLLNGLIEEKKDNSIKVISYLPKIKTIYKEKGEKEVYKGIKIRHLWCDKNKLISVFFALKKNIELIKVWASKEGEKVILIYSANPIHIIPAFMLRKKFNLKIVTLCSEISIYRRKDKENIVTKISRQISHFWDGHFNGYILLSKYMNEVVNKKNRPYMIMEGISRDRKFAKNERNNNVVFYAGGLTEDNGIRILLDGFILLKDIQKELWICGDGPLKILVEKYEKKYENIRYLGLIENQRVQEIEEKVGLLIAPRFSGNLFTKYSFPSKTIEYLSSGTPTVLTRLKGIPDEYFSYVYLLEDETARGVCKLLEEIYAQNEKDRLEFARRAQDFVIKTKSERIQARRIWNFLKAIVKV